jgi:hypothetical protein
MPLNCVNIAQALGNKSLSDIIKQDIVNNTNSIVREVIEKVSISFAKLQQSFSSRTPITMSIEDSNRINTLSALISTISNVRKEENRAKEDIEEFREDPARSNAAWEDALKNKLKEASDNIVKTVVSSLKSTDTEDDIKENLEEAKETNSVKYIIGLAESEKQISSLYKELISLLNQVGDAKMVCNNLDSDGEVAEYSSGIIEFEHQVNELIKWSNAALASAAKGNLEDFIDHLEARDDVIDRKSQVTEQFKEFGKNLSTLAKTTDNDPLGVPPVSEKPFYAKNDLVSPTPFPPLTLERQETNTPTTQPLRLPIDPTYNPPHGHSPSKRPGVGIRPSLLAATRGQRNHT